MHVGRDGGWPGARDPQFPASVCQEEPPVSVWCSSFTSQNRGSLRPRPAVPETHSLHKSASPLVGLGWWLGCEGVVSHSAPQELFKPPNQSQPPQFRETWVESRVLPELSRLRPGQHAVAALGGGGRASLEPQGGDAHRRGCAAAPGDLQADRRIRWLRSYSGPRGVLVLILGWLSREAELAWHLETNPYRQLRVCTQDKPILPIKGMYPTFPYNVPLFYSGLGVRHFSDAAWERGHPPCRCLSK